VTGTSIPLPRLSAIDRRQMVLRTVDVELLIDEDHSARAIWELVGRLDLSLYYAQIASVQGRAGREHTDPQLLISLWLYAYSRGISSARAISRQCEHEPAFQWLCGLESISHRTLSGFRSDYKTALDDLFVQVLGMLSSEGLISLERVTLDGTKSKANASGNTFRRKEKIEAHLALAREQVWIMEEQAADEEKIAKRLASARRRAARQRTSRLEAALREVERLQRDKKSDRDGFVARASSTDPEAHVMRNGEGGTVPSYNVQLVTDTTHGLIVNVEATTDPTDYRQLEPALDRCQETLGCRPQQIVADGDYTNHASVQAAATRGVDFYGSWPDSWKPGERDAQGRGAAFQASVFTYNAERVRTAESAAPMGPRHHSDRGTRRDDRVQSQDADRRSPANLPPTVADRRVSTRMDQRAMRAAAVSLPGPAQSGDGGNLGVPQLQRHKMVPHPEQSHRLTSRDRARIGKPNG